MVQTTAADSVAIDGNGKIVVAGGSYNGTDTDVAVVRYNADGSLDTTFDFDGKVTTATGTDWDDASSVALQSDGKILVAGWTSNATDQDFVVLRYKTGGPWTSALAATVRRRAISALASSRCTGLA